MSEQIVTPAGPQDPAPAPGRRFWASALTTVLIGVAVAGFAIFRFRTPRPVIVESSPVVQVVEKEVVRLVEKVAPPPAKEPPPPPVAPPEATPPPLLTEAMDSNWRGVWRRKESPLPMVKVSASALSASGVFAPDMTAVLPFRDGQVLGENLEFTVQNEVFRTHFRMTLVGPDKAKMVCWITNEDWLAALVKAKARARTPQQAVILRAILENNAKMLGKPYTVGVFMRYEEGG